MKGFEAQAHTVASLTTKVQDLQVRQDVLQKERIAAQGINAALRDTVLRSLKAEQADLQQRLKKMTEYIKEVEQADSVVAAPMLPLSSVPAVDRSDKSPAETHAPKGPDGSQLQK